MRLHYSYELGDQVLFARVMDQAVIVKHVVNVYHRLAYCASDQYKVMHLGIRY